jgi:hypothetical protein
MPALFRLLGFDYRFGLRVKDANTPSSGNEVTRDAKYYDAGQDQKRHCASYTTSQAVACEMTGHGPGPPTSNQLTGSSLYGSPLYAQSALDSSQFWLSSIIEGARKRRNKS